MQSSVSLLSSSSDLSDELDRNGAHVPLDINVIKEPISSPPPQDKEASMVQDSCTCCQCKKTTTKSSRLDLHYVNDRIISMGAPSMSTQINDDTDSVPLGDHGDESSTQRGLKHNRDMGPLHESDKMILPPRPQSPQIVESNGNVGKEQCISRNNVVGQGSQDPTRKRCTESTQFEGNCPQRLSRFLNRHHANHYMVFNISSTIPSSRTLSLLNNQVVNLPWTCPGINGSSSIDSSAPTAASIPTLKCLLDICYAIDAYIQMDEKNMAVIYCSNGKTRTGIAVAAYLKYVNSQSKQLDIYTSLEGFRLFCSRTCRDLVKDEDIDDLIPPSLKTLFGNFDALIECGGTIQKDPLVLRAITLQGLPVEEMPRIDVWNEHGILFSSHDDKEYTFTLKDVDSPQINQEKKTLLWADDDAFYRVNKQIEGDFLLLCRFGGEYAHDTDDPTKVILRYANNTSFLFSAPYELPKTKVDLMRRYSHDVEEADFLLTLLFDNLGADEESNNELQKASGSFSVLESSEALYRGWNLIHNFHSYSADSIRCNLVENDLTLLQKYYHGGIGIESLPYPAPNMLLLILALQVSNGDLNRAVNELLEKSMKSMWKESLTQIFFSIPQLRSSKKNIPQCQKAESEIEGEKQFMTQVTTNRRPCNGSQNDGNRRAKVKSNVNYYLCCNESSLSTIIKDIELDSHIVEKYNSDTSSIHLHKRQLPCHVNEEIPDRRCYDKQGQDCKLIQGQDCKGSLSSPNMFFPQPSFVSSDPTDVCIKRGDLSDYSVMTGKNSCRLNTSHMTMNEHSVSPHSTGLFFSNTVDADILTYVARSRITVDDLMHFIKKMDDPQRVHTETMDSVKGSSDTINQMKGRRRKSLDLGSLDSLCDQIYDKFDKSDGDSDKIVLFHEGTRIEGYITAKDSQFYTIKIPTKTFVQKLCLKTKAQVVNAADSKDGETQNELLKATAVLVETDDRHDANQSVRNEIDSRRESSNIDSCACAAIDGTAPNESTKIEQASAFSEDDLPIKDDPKYEKYFKMLKVGLPAGAVKNALQKDGQDPSIVDLDPNKSFKSQQNYEVKSDSSSEDDQANEKYFRMLKMGLPIGAVKNALQRDGKDPSIIDKDIKLSAHSRSTSTDKSDETDLVLKDDPQYSKYFRMLKMGLPIGAVKNALQRDGKDPAIIDLDPNKSVGSQTKCLDKVVDKDVKLQDDPEYSKYFRMLKMGLPVGAVKNALQRDGKDSSIIDLDPDKPAKDQLKPDVAPEKDTGIPLKDDPEYTKYFKMLKMGLPIGAVQNALQRDGKETFILDLDPNFSLDYHLAKRNQFCPVATGIPLKDDPEYQKYFKMLKMGLPIGAVQNALQRDGKDPSIIELNPNQSVEYQLMMKKNEKQATKKEKKPKVRRKKIYWNAIDKSKVKKDSLWGQIRGMFAMEKLKIDNSEFESLFTETLDPSQKRKKAENSKNSLVVQKKSVQVIEAKKGMNGGIILARIKLDFSVLARIVDHMIYGKLDSTQLLALKQFLPTDDEAAGLKAYVANAGKNEAKTKEIMNALCPCEKYMLAMMDVPNAAEKFDSMLFQIQFKSKIEEINESISSLIKACDDVKISNRFRELLAIILTIGNQINTGGDGNMAEGFTLDALLKLNEAKAFDKKTSVLQYVIKVINKNDPELLKFVDEILSIEEAKDIMLDSVISDLQQLQDDLERVKSIATKEGHKYRDQEGKLTNPDFKITLSQLKEQKTYNRIIDGVKFYNQMEKDTEFTPMELFTQSAEYSIVVASERIKGAKEKFLSLLSYFGEDEKMSTIDFFGTLSNFRKAFESEKELYEKQEMIRIRDMKRLAKQNEKLKSDARTPPTTSHSLPSSYRPQAVIATAADSQQKIQERLMTNEGKADNADALKTGMIGVAAMAAAAARKKQAQDDAVSKDGRDASRNAIGMGGIAAMAAAAARKKQVQDVDASKDGRDASRNAIGMGGIAAMAAAAARKKQAQDDDVSKNGSDASRNAIGMGGIAAMAAAAARKKQAQDDDASKDDGGCMVTSTNLIGMGVSAMTPYASSCQMDVEVIAATEDDCDHCILSYCDTYQVDMVSPIPKRSVFANTTATVSENFDDESEGSLMVKDNAPNQNLSVEHRVSSIAVEADVGMRSPQSLIHFSKGKRQTFNSTILRPYMPDDRYSCNVPLDPHSKNDALSPDEDVYTSSKGDVPKAYIEVSNIYSFYSMRVEDKIDEISDTITTNKKLPFPSPDSPCEISSDNSEKKVVRDTYGMGFSRIAAAAAQAALLRRNTTDVTQSNIADDSDIDGAVLGNKCCHGNDP